MCCRFHIGTERLVISIDLCCLADFSVMTVGDPLQHILRVFQQVPAIGHLNGLRRTLLDSVGICRRSVVADDTDFRMIL